MLKLKVESREIRDLKALVANETVDATEINNKLIIDYFYV
jgi:hypothetical protein